MRERILLSIMADWPYAATSLPFLIEEAESETWLPTLLKCLKNLTEEDVERMVCQEGIEEIERILAKMKDRGVPLE